MLELLSGHHDVNGWNTVFVGVCLLCAFQAYKLLQKRTEGRRGGVLACRQDGDFMLAGFIMLCMGVAVRIGGWLPWRSMLLAGREDLAAWYVSFSSYWTAAGALLCVVGMVAITKPLLRQYLGRRTWIGTAVLTLGFYSWGVIWTEILRRFL